MNKEQLELVNAAAWYYELDEGTAWRDRMEVWLKLLDEAVCTKEQNAELNENKN